MLTRLTGTPLWILFSLPLLAECYVQSPKWLNVNTTSGVVQGHVIDNRPEVVEYLGIPFAKPPIDDLRFAPPERFHGTNVINGTAYGFSCPSFESGPMSYPQLSPQAQDILDAFTVVKGTEALQDEDCLTLNIWTKPSPASDGTGKPVVVFIYGGRFALGTANSPMYNGKYLADAQDLVVVTFNYRTNIFGFPGLAGKAQNLGLRDQRIAVEWVRENIAAFGGDPDKITLIGQSAGSMAVDFWSYAHVKDPIVKGLWAMSGNALTRPATATQEVYSNFQLVVKAINCTSTFDELACMRQADWSTIRDAASRLPSVQTTNPLRTWAPFSPTPDDELVFDDYINRTKSGHFAKIPIIFSNTHKEEGYYQVPLLQRGIEPTLKQAADFMLERFTCANALQSASRIANSVPSWLVRYFGDYSNTRLYPGSGPYHGVDVHMIFGASEDVTGLPLSAAETQLVALMQRALSAFAHDPHSGLEAVMSWPQFNESRKSLVLLGVENAPEARLVFPRAYNAACNHTVYEG